MSTYLRTEGVCSFLNDTVHYRQVSWYSGVFLPLQMQLNLSMSPPSTPPSAVYIWTQASYSTCALLPEHELSLSSHINQMLYATCPENNRSCMHPTATVQPSTYGLNSFPPVVPDPKSNSCTDLYNENVVEIPSSPPKTPRPSNGPYYSVVVLSRP